MIKNGWHCVYERAVKKNGDLFFPQKLSESFLDTAKRTMGSWLFANQYQNEIVPDGTAPFKKEWIRYFKELPTNVHSFVSIDPAISTDDSADYTAFVVVKVDVNQNWYIVNAIHGRYTPTEIVETIFRISQEYQPLVIGIEDVAYQKSLLYMLDEEARRRNTVLPIKGIRPDTNKTKEQRILGLVPRFEWARIFWNQGLHDLENEYVQFPRAKNDDLIDALAQMEQIIVYPSHPKPSDEAPPTNHPDYEKWYIKNLYKRSEDYA